MKRVALIGTLCAVVLLTSACNAKKLVCTSNGSDIGRKTATTMEIFFSGKEASKIKEKIEINFEEGYRESIDTYYTVLKESYSKDNLGAGIDVKVTKGDANIDVNLTIDVNKQKNSENATSDVDTSGTRNEIKKELQNQGYTCK